MTWGRVGVFRLLLGTGFVLSAALWLFHTVPSGQRVLLTVAGGHMTRLDLAAVPLLVSGVLLVLVGGLARHQRRAREATVWLALAGVIGWVAAWWVSANPFGEGAVLARLGHHHGLTQSDVLVLPVITVAFLCGVLGSVALVRSATLDRNVGDGSI